MFMFRKISVRESHLPRLYFCTFHTRRRLHAKESVIRRYLLIKITNTQTLIQGLILPLLLFRTQKYKSLFLTCFTFHVPFNLIGGGLSLCGVVSAYFLYKIFYLHIRHTMSIDFILTYVLRFF